MEQVIHVIKRCSDCDALLRSARIDPHEYLVIIQHTPEEDIYRCLLCDTCLSYSPTGEQAWARIEMKGTGCRPRDTARTSGSRTFR